MRPILLLKILLLISCMYVSIRLFFLDHTIDQSIQAQYDTLAQLKTDPYFNTPKNFDQRGQIKKSAIAKIESLRKTKHPSWYKNMAILFAPIAGWLIRSIIATLRKKRTNNRI